MSVKVEATVAGADPVVHYFQKELRLKVRRALRAAATALVIHLRRVVSDTKLKGQVLNVRTGTLRRSINLGEPTVLEEGTKITGLVGTNLIYGRAWELGRVKNWQGKVQPARPFLRPALDESKALIRAKLKGALGKGGSENPL